MKFHPSLVLFFSLAMVPSMSTADSSGIRGQIPSLETVGDGEDHTDSKLEIHGGQAAFRGQFPFFVDLNGCGGSLIAPQVVLTAAHCKIGTRGILYNGKVIVGAYQRGIGTRDVRRVTGFSENPYYKEHISLDHDLQLMRLDSPVPSFKQMNFEVSLNPSDKNMTPLVGMGMGPTYGGDTAANTILRWAEFTKRDMSVCHAKAKKIFGKSGWYGDHLCVAQTGKVTCPGDSGSPLVVEKNGAYVQVGVLSGGFPHCTASADDYSVYMQPYREFEWMKRTICLIWKLEWQYCGHYMTHETQNEDGDFKMITKEDDDDEEDDDATKLMVTSIHDEDIDDDDDDDDDDEDTDDEKNDKFLRNPLHTSY